MLRLYTDGACSNNGGNNSVGGWAYCIVTDGDEILKCDSGAAFGSTNNEMEYTAMLKGLEAVTEIVLIGDVNCYTDSALLFNTLTQWIEGWRANGWKRKSGPVRNLELVKALYPFTQMPGIHFNLVKGHDGGKDENSKWNEYVDKLAVGARKNLKL